MGTGLLNKALQKLSHFFGEETAIDLLSRNQVNEEELLGIDFLSSLLHYRIYDSEQKIFENQNSFGFFLEVPPLLSINDSIQREINEVIREVGEAGDCIQCLLYADPRIDPFIENWSDPRRDQGGIFSKLAEKKAQFLRDEVLDGESPSRIFRFFLSFSCPKPTEQQKIAFCLNRLKEKRKKVIETFSRFSYVYEQTPEDFISILSGLLNFDQDPSVYTRKKYNPDSYLSEQLCLPGGAMDVRPDGLIFNGKRKSCFRSYEAIDFPDEWTMGLNHELLGDFFNGSYRIPSPFFIHYGIHFPDEDKVKSKLISKKALLASHMRLGTFVKMFPNKVQENEEHTHLNQQLKEGEKVIQTRLSIGLFGSEKHFLKSESTLLSLYQKYGFKLRENKFMHLHDFLFSLPMAWGDSSAYMSSYKKRMLLRTTVTSEIATFIPITGEWWGNSQEGMVMTGRRGQLASWDPFKVGGNLNTVVIGPSGSGKSVFMQDLIMSELGKGTHVFVLDLGRSFEKLCQLIDGQYLFFNQDSKLDLNPFNLLPRDADFESIGILLDMVTSIIATMAMPAEKIDKERGNILSSAVRQVWELKGTSASIDDIIHLIEKQVFNSELMKGAMESLKEGLQKYTKNGVYKNYFYGSHKVNFNSSLVVIETEELKNMADLQAVILQIFVLNISQQVFMGDREKRFLICIDEAWDLLKSPQMEGFIESMARRLRKYNGALVVGTQSLKDFERSHGARAAYHNSNWLVMLGKDTDSINALKKDGSVQLTAHTEEALNSLRKEDGKYSEAFIFHKQDGLRALLQLRLDPFSAMLYSTKADEFQAIQELKAFGMSIEESVDWLMKSKSEFDAAIRKGYRVKDVVLNICQRQGKFLVKKTLSSELLKKTGTNSACV